MRSKQVGLAKQFTSLVFAFGALMCAPGAVMAASIIFDDTSPAETITVLANDFEGGFFVNGVQIQQGLNNPGSATVAEAGPLTFFGAWIDLGQNAPTVRTIYLVEAGDPTIISDLLQYQVFTDGTFATIAGFFVSDVGNNQGSLPVDVNPADVFVEDGSPVLFTAAFLSGQILSDVEAVPEPGTLALLGLALLPLARLTRRKTIG
jgi:hypothetical protein